VTGHVFVCGGVSGHVFVCGGKVLEKSTGKYGGRVRKKIT
jgi:hypothetical protein